ncbi:MAG: cytochrome c [Pseudomonadota bacterium]
MAYRKSSFTLCAAAVLGLTACGGGGDAVDPNAGSEMLSNGMTVKAQIEARQDGFKAIGAEFKTINDQLRSGSPDIAAIQAAATKLPEVSAGIADWFPQGTGPESGVETEALAIIWDEPEDYAAKVNDFKAAIEALEIAAQTGEVESVQAAAQATGGTCKACHDKYRLDD